MKQQPMSLTDIARIWRDVMGANRLSTTEIEAVRAIIAARDAQWAAMIGEPVAYLKTWDSVGNAQTGMRRLDFKAESETWLGNVFPEVLPLYAIKETP